MRVDNDLLSLLGVLDGGNLDGTLVAEQRSKRRLDKSSGECENDETDDKDGEGGAGGNNLGSRGNEQQEMCDDTNSGTDTNGLESTPFGVGNDGSKDGNDVGEEGEHGSDGRSLDGSESEGTGRLVDPGSSRSDGTGTVSAFGKRSSNEVLENVLTTIVRCSLAQFDETHGDTDPTDGCRDPALSTLFHPSGDQLITHFRKVLNSSSVGVKVSSLARPWSAEVMVTSWVAGGPV